MRYIQKNPILFVIFSLIPGLGHMYFGQRKRGFIYLLLIVGTGYLGYRFFSERFFIWPISFIALFFYLVDVMNLYPRVSFGEPVYKDPDLAFTLSFLLPGLGQLYNGQWLKAILCFLLGGPGLLILARIYGPWHDTVWLVGLWWPIFYLFTLVDALVVATDLSEEYGVAS